MGFDQQRPSGRSDGPGGPRRGGGRPGGGGSRRRVCQFCADKIPYVDYKDIGRLARHLSERGKIEGRRKTSTCARHQRQLSVALKRARHLALLPYTAGHVRPREDEGPRGYRGRGGRFEGGRSDGGRYEGGRSDGGRSEGGRFEGGRSDDRRPDAGRPEQGRSDYGRQEPGRPQTAGRAPERSDGEGRADE